jgi:pilus assembly protein Flp/PilA
MAKRLWREEEGQTLIEYGLLTALIAIISLAILNVLGKKVRDAYTTVNGAMTTSA